MVSAKFEEKWLSVPQQNGHRTLYVSDEDGKANNRTKTCATTSGLTDSLRYRLDNFEIICVAEDDNNNYFVTVSETFSNHISDLKTLL